MISLFVKAADVQITASFHSKAKSWSSKQSTMSFHNIKYIWKTEELYAITTNHTTICCR